MRPISLGSISARAASATADFGAWGGEVTSRSREAFAAVGLLFGALLFAVGSALFVMLGPMVRPIGRPLPACPERYVDSPKAAQGYRMLPGKSKENRGIGS